MYQLGAGHFESTASWKSANFICGLLVPRPLVEKIFKVAECFLGGTETLYLFNKNSKLGLIIIIIYAMRI